MRKARVIGLLALCSFAFAALRSQEPAASTETPSRPFAIKQTWLIGGAGPWDYLTLDARAQRLYIAHNHTVQVVDVTTGTVAGEITGLTDAHCVVLDDTGEFGYVSDGRGGKVIVFERRSLQTVATIENVPSPRALVFEPQTRLLFAIRTDAAAPVAAPSTPRTTTHITLRPPRPAPPAPNPSATSSIAVIDTQSQKMVGQILLSGTLGYGQADGRGEVFVNVTDRNEILHFDAQSLDTLLPRPSNPGPPSSNAAASGAPNPPAALPAPSAKKSESTATIDWSDKERQVARFSLNRACVTPRALAIDSAHARLFAACDNMRLFVLNSQDGNVIANLPIGPGVDAIGYDAGRNLIYSANGGGGGSLTIISQNVTDTYSVIQTLPTRQRANTLAVNPDTGEVYLVTDLLGVRLSPSGGIGTLQTNPLDGSFQVVVVGN